MSQQDRDRDNDYLWNGSGTPDAEVAALEASLAPLRGRPRALALPEDASVGVTSRRRVMALVAAGAAAAAVWVVWGPAPAPITGGRASSPSSSSSTWQASALAGSPRVGERALGAQGSLAQGEWLETDATSRAKLDVGDAGALEVEPATRLRIVRTAADEHRIALVRGRIRATIWAAPRVVSIETPNAVAVDLGCVYTLGVDGQGTTELAVEIGWVAIAGEGREVFVPGGASSRTRTGAAPGTPRFADAPSALRDALDRLDAGDLGALAAALGAARAHDVLSVWHLLRTVPAESRGVVYDRLAALAPPPAGVAKPAILAADPEALDRWWDSLGLGAASTFRTFRTPQAP